MCTTTSSADQWAHLARARSLPDLFRRVARVDAALSAVRAGERTLTDQELDRLSDRLASRLVHDGVRLNDPGGRAPRALHGALDCFTRSAQVQRGRRAARPGVPARSTPRPRGRRRIEVVFSSDVSGPGRSPRRRATGRGREARCRTAAATRRRGRRPVGVRHLQVQLHRYARGLYVQPQRARVPERRLDAAPRRSDQDDGVALFHPLVLDPSEIGLWAALACGGTASVTLPWAARARPRRATAAVPR